MERIITILLLFVSTFAFAQTTSTEPVQSRTDIIRYDFNSYKGTPIQKGWLFNDETYQKLYFSYNAADSLIKSFEAYNKVIKKLDSLNKQLPLQYESRIKDKDDVIAKQQTNIKDLNDLLKTSNENVEKIQKQFITIGKIKIHKGTAIKVGLSGLVVGYLIGKF